ncbi:hypothetical protein [Peptacetobacter sp.]|uniref:hypothetical protein n=1 Tax=Peptacetobacter sp. TaxID=2991975 RepID=UPI0026034ED6|nr:hypothetical protein [Peptacetobacter sp.]
MKNKSTLMTILGILVICLCIMLGINLKTYIENREKNSIRPILKSQETLEPEIKEAINKLYRITGDNKERVVYKYNPTKNYIMEDFIKKNYYVFNVIDADKDGQITNIRKCNYLVNKNTNDTNIYFAGGQMNILENENSWKVKEEYKSYFYEMKPEIKKAYERIGNTLSDTVKENYYKYEYSPELEEIGNKKYNLNDEYYVFSDYNLDENAVPSEEGDVDLAVKKKNMEVYEFSIAAYPNNYILPYGDENLGLENWQIECKKIHDGMCSTAEEHNNVGKEISVEEAKKILYAKIGDNSLTFDYDYAKQSNYLMSLDKYEYYKNNYYIFCVVDDLGDMWDINFLVRKSDKAIFEFSPGMTEPQLY